MKKFALAGNPNCGKTTLFNLLTGSTAYVGNWPGVTVDKREGVYKKGEESVSIIDLPGIYSLSPYTPEEIISRNFILDEKPDCIINIVDATNLERNLYLTTQLMEIDVPMIIALNMMDELEKKGDVIDAKQLEERLGIPVVAISALKGSGIKELMERGIKASKTPREGATVLHGSALAHLIGDVKIALVAQKVENPLFHAVKLTEMDEIEVGMHPDLIEMVDAFKATFSDEIFGNDFEAIVADERYKYISENYSVVLTKNSKDTQKLSKSDKADKVLTHRVWGIPIFLVILFAIFHFTFGEDLFYIGALSRIGGGEGLPTLEALGLLDAEGEATGWAALLATFYDGAIASPGVFLANILTLLLDTVSGWVASWFVALPESAAWVSGFVVDGVLGGLFAVLGFLPQILTLFLFFSILEDSGYMARVAFILDRIFRKFGLSGRAFMPMIMGFGCSLPAMINTRTLADERERTTTIRVIPFFSCGAKLPILTGVAGAIVSFLGVGNADVITYSMYLVGIVTAIVCVILMRYTSMRGKVEPFIMELPTYHRPLFKGLMIHLWDKTKHFIKKAFSIILVSTILIWVFTHFNWSWGYLEDEAIDQSILGSLGKLIQPIFTPLGFGSQLGTLAGWVFAVGAITGLVAKENVIATFGALAASVLAITGASAPELIDPAEGVLEVSTMIAATGITVPGLISFIVFNMTTIPCFAATATAKAELPKGKFRGTIFFWLATSYVVSAMIYLIGSWWWTAFIFAAVIALAVGGIVLWNKKHPVAEKSALERMEEGKA